ncbi:MAG TPA: heavy metal translocating P-type ATPase [Gemmatimonadaceae bacterium]
MRYRLPIAATLAAALGGAAMLLPGGADTAHKIWLTGLILCGAPVVYLTVRGLMRGKFAADVIASMTVVASLVLGHPLVGLVIVIMQTGGEALEKFAEGKATDALRQLQDITPHRVRRVNAAGAVEEIDVAEMHRGDHVLVRPGEIVPCDGEIASGSSHLDTSTITGEPVPIRVNPGSNVMSGSINGESPLVVRASAPAEESQFAKIVALVREAQASKAPLQRIADRFAVWFTPLTIAVCGIAYAISGSPDRILAVLAIATPCPLILATPVAILGGMNRSAKHHILVRSGGALEALAGATAVVFDKTGTITIGRPRVTQVIALNGLAETRILQLAGAIEQGSSHLLARTLVDEAIVKGVKLPRALDVTETPGRGVMGIVEDFRVAIGARSFIAERFPGTRRDISENDSGNGESALRAYVAVDGELKGIVEYGDQVRDGIPALVSSLRNIGIQRVLLLSGDRSENARAVARASGIADARGDMLPEDKVEVVKGLIDNGESVVMVGDGTNDAPALGTATVGVALASHGRGIATESADVILLADNPALLMNGIQISRRTMRIARQSIWFGLAISLAGMAFAAAGRIVPIAGAAIQEAVDLAVILNALRASRAPRSTIGDT